MIFDWRCPIPRKIIFVEEDGFTYKRPLRYQEIMSYIVVIAERLCRFTKGVKHWKI